MDTTYDIGRQQCEHGWDQNGFIQSGITKIPSKVHILPLAPLQLRLTWWLAVAVNCIDDANGVQVYK